jgi:hypothetical protein
LILRLAAVLVLSFLPGNLFGQEARANIQGKVTDPQGAAVPGAQISVISESTNVTQEATTNEQGSWTVRFLNPGSYRIVVSVTGFKTVERKGVVLQTADMRQLDIVLEMGQVAETITVSADPPLIDTTAATSGTVITGEAVTEMPIMSRIPFQLATMSPGVMAVDQNNNVAMMWSRDATSAVRVNGGRDDRSNEFLLDGMPNQHRDKVAFIPPADAVAEFRIMTNAYDAQYGRQAGGTMNVSVKSGSNDYHGNVYEFNRNDAYSANTFQANRSGLPKSMTRYNLWGGTFGGPVRLPKLFNGRDKTFFFVSYEGIRNQDPRAGTRSVPTAEEREGDFNNSWTTQTIGGVRTVIPISIFDPLTADTRRTITQDGKDIQNPQFGYRQPFSGNRVPVNRISSISKNILGFIPLPNTPNQPGSNTANNFTPNSTRQNKMATIMGRGDHNWNNSHKTFATVRWSHMDEVLGNDFHNVTTGGSRTRINRGAGLDHVWVIDAAKVLNIRSNVTRFEEPYSDTGSGFNPASLGFPQSYVSQMERLSFPRITGMFGDIGGKYGDYANTTSYSWSANLTHTVGNMTLHYGGEYRILQDASGDSGNQSGQFDFNSEWTRQRYDTGATGSGSATAAFLLGIPSGGSFPRNANRFFSQRYAGVFFQNDWRVTDRLTVNVGLRWDYQRPSIERFRRTVSDFDPTVRNPISDSAQAAYGKILNTVLANPVQYPFGPQLAQMVPVSSFQVYGAQLYAGVNGQPITATNSVYDQWQPRVGAAYRLDSKTVIRGGFGKFYQSSGSTQGQNGFSQSTPFLDSIDSGLTLNDTFAKPFQAGILEPTGNTLGAMTNLGGGVNWLSRDGHLPYAWEYSMHVQREFRSWLFEVGYSHNNTYNIYQDRQQNDIGLENWQALRQPRFDANGKPLARPYFTDEQIPNPFYNLPGVTGSRGSATLIGVYELLRPIKILGGQSRSGNPLGKNGYDSMQAKIERRFRNGFSMLFSYTFSKLFEDTSFLGPELAGYVEHKLGGEDRPHKVSIAPVLQFPIGRGKAYFANMPKALDAVVGGWQLSGQYIIQSGAPVVFGTNSFFDGQDMSIPRNERALDRWFETEHFVKFPNSGDDISRWPAWTGVHSLPGANYVYADFGNYIRKYPTRWSNVRASRTNELNLGLFKNFRFGERVKAQLRGEFFNIFNHARFGHPNTDPGSSVFGVVTPSQVNQPRVGQMALKISF